MMKLSFVCLLATLLVISGCINQKTFLQRFIPKEEDSLARTFIEAIRNMRYDDAMNMLDPNLRTADTRNQLEGMHRMCDEAQPLSIETVSVSWNHADKTQYFLSYQIQFPRFWLLAEMVIEKDDNNLYITRAQYNPLPESLETTNAFNFSNKTASQYFFFGLFVLVPLFMVYVIIVEVRSKIRRKWLWLIGTLVGIGNFYMNWQTGEVWFQPIAFKIPEVGMYRSGLYGPWFLYISAPVVAIIFLLKRRKLMERSIRDGELEVRATESTADEKSNELI